MYRIITLEEGMNKLEEGIGKARMILDGYPTNALFNAEDYNNCVYYMCVQHPPHDYSLQLYERFKRALEESISLKHSSLLVIAPKLQAYQFEALTKVLPSLMDKNGAPLLTELLHMWAKYKVMVKCLGGFFLYLDRHFADGKSAAPLRDVSVVCFHDLVFVKFYDKCRDCAIDLISEDRAEKTIDRGLLKNISSFFMEIGGQGNTSYYESFEKAIIADVSIYYSSLASEWLFRYSCTDYIWKAEWCLNQVNARASQFLYQTSVEKLLQVLSSSLVLYHCLPEGLIALQLCSVDNQYVELLK
ncbi:hypothetical protein RJ639_002297 [Escallonia herrerae]|uniref:Cullin N-terminal domain-containing protein n=1 Tax=Escallonia herrerae TaxID=1293975 RepID=A0AA88XCG4_9ASTE|nr:hypothetical protein RJ639_002297 [Escallonia herrerae]